VVSTGSFLSGACQLERSLEKTAAIGNSQATALPVVPAIESASRGETSSEEGRGFKPRIMPGEITGL